MPRFDLTDYEAQAAYEAEQDYRRSQEAWFETHGFGTLTPEELADEQRVIAEDQAARDEGNFYQRRQYDDSIPF